MSTKHFGLFLIVLTFLAVIYCHPFYVLGQDPPIRALQAKDIFELELASDPQISPDGKSIVYCRRSNDIMTDRTRSKLWIVDTDGKNHRPLTDFQIDASSPRWSPDQTRIAYVGTDGKNTQIFCYWLATGKTAKLTSLQKSPEGMRWSRDGKSIAFANFVESKVATPIKMPAKPKGAEWADPPKIITTLKYRADGRGYLTEGFTHLFVISAEGGTARQLTSGDYNHGSDFTWAKEDSCLIFPANRTEDAELNSNLRNLYSIDVGNGKLTQLTRRNGSTGSPIELSDGRLLFTGNVDNLKGFQLSRLYQLQPDGTELLISEEFDRSIRSVQRIPGKDDVLFLYDDQGQTSIGRFSVNAEFKKVTNDVGGTMVGRPYSSGSFSVANDGRIAYTKVSPTDLANVGIINADGSSVQITDLNGDLFPFRDLGEVTTLDFTSSFDNRKIQGWYITPPGFDDQKKYPMILEIHGGPFANYGPRFSAEMQLYAAAGYIVLYINPRGSTSYGEEFANLIHHRYPGDDYHDLMSGVDAMIEKGIVDEQKLFVTGGSGGGVLTSWIVGKSDRFAAAVVAKPVINWFSFALTADSYNYFYKYWFPGYPWDHPQHYLDRSPIMLAGKINTPTMLLTGESDYRTPISESEQLYQALKLRKIDTAMVRIPKAGHGITARPSNLIAKTAYILYWFEKYTKK